MSEYDISVGSGPGKTADARKIAPPAAGTSTWAPTMLNPTSGLAGAPVDNQKGKSSEWDVPAQGAEKTLDARKKVAKAAGTSDFKPTLI